MKGRGIEICIIPSNIIDIYSRLKVLLGLKLSCHTATLTEASKIIDEHTREVKLRTNNNIQMLLINFIPNKWNYLKNF